MEEKNSPKFRRGRGLIIAEAAVEYFIHLCVTATLLTAILNHMEISASLQGIINAIASLACSVQLLAVFFVRKTYPCKRWVSILNLVSQLLFVGLYCLPLTGFFKTVKIVLFIGTLLFAYAFQHYLTPSRTNWQMSLVADNKRGVFTANKEIVSLIGGMIFSQGAGILLDYLKLKGKIELCFIIFALTITVLSVLHLVLMLSTHEPKPETVVPPKKFGDILRIVFGNPNLRLVIIFDVLYVVSLVSLHYSNKYLTDHQLSYTYITAVGVIHAAFRALVSRRLGKFADKHSWVSLMMLCMTVLAIGFLIFALTPVSALFFLYPIFSLCYAFALGGLNSGRTNLCLDYVKHEDRRYILGVQFAISGIIGFLATLVASAFVDHMEKTGNVLFGITVYPQQVLYMISFVMIVLLVIFFLPRLKKGKRTIGEDSSQA